MVELRQIGYRAGATRILGDVTATLPANRFSVILGPNGAGKSTLLRIAAGLLPPTAGEVRYDGRALTSFTGSELACMRAMLSQSVTLAFPLPVEEVVMMGRYPHYGRAPTARDRKIVHEAIELVGLSERAAQPYPTLSGGEQQKAQLARVLAQIWRDGASDQSRYLFLDEPTSSLDVQFQLQLLDLARSLVREGCTVVAILHDINVALEYGEHLLLLERGGVALESDQPRAVAAEVLERVFHVRAHRVHDGTSADALWRFTL